MRDPGYFTLVFAGDIAKQPHPFKTETKFGTPTIASRGNVCDERDRLEERVEKLEDALYRIREWSKAYPLDVFPEPDWKKARAVLEAAGMTLDAVSAGAMRRVVEGVGKIAREALGDDPPEARDW